MIFKKKFVISMFIVSASILRTSAAYKQDEKYMKLIKAVERGETTVVQKLLAAGAPFDNTILHLAARKGCASIVETLLVNKASVDARGAEYDWNCYDFDPLMSRIYPALHLAARFGHAATVKVLLAGGASVDKKLYENFNSGTALDEAVIARNSEVVRVLLNEYYDALLRRFPVIGYIENGDLENQTLFILPHEIWETIATYLSPSSIANFRLTGKKFCMFASKSLKNIAKKRLLRLKEDLIGRIGLTIIKAQEQYVLQEEISTAAGQVALMAAEQEEVMRILITEHVNAQGLDINGLLQGIIICNGNPRPSLTTSTCFHR